jgi:adenosine deaminase
MARLAASDLTLCAAPSSNLSTSVYDAWSAIPLQRLLDAGVKVCLSADDPTIFSTSTAREYALAGRELRISDAALDAMRKAAWNARFGAM